MTALQATPQTTLQTLALAVVDLDRRPNTTFIRPLEWYDYLLVSFSGGKDSVALVLSLLKRGVPKEKILLLHQHVDGEPGVDAPFMDWPCTESYCRAFARALGLRLLFQWRHGGFLREMLKDGARTAPVTFERLDGTTGTAGGIRGKLATRRLFPMPIADLGRRWCSSTLKIDVAAMAIAGEPAFKGKRLLFLTGERRQESTARSKYAEAEEHRTHTRSRHVDHWRLVIDWTEAEVWAIMAEYQVQPHPAYRLGWGRVSCLACIFGQEDQWASVRKIAPETFEKIARYEEEFGKTIAMDGRTVRQLADKGTPYPGTEDAALVALAMGKDYPAEQVLTDAWQMPAGAFKHCGGPT
jgi:3'-phosphoadenosine 5'-phosphosulfate sulfotransferase (PAPS reductase)/FAD synthetase